MRGHRFPASFFTGAKTDPAQYKLTHSSAPFQINLVDVPVGAGSAQHTGPALALRVAPIGGSFASRSWIV